jgi:hypothetical protein
VLVHLGAANNLTAVNGAIVPDINLGASPKLSADQAGKLVIVAAVADPPTNDEGGAAALRAGDLSASATLYV